MTVGDDPPTPPWRAPHRIAIIGSGNFGTAIARLVGQNVLQQPTEFQPEVRMWVYEEKVGDRFLSEIINKDHVNVKYLPGIKLPSNVIADPDLAGACHGATILIFVLPHQFLRKPHLLLMYGVVALSVMPVIRAHVKPHVIAISLIKGLEFSEEGDPCLISHVVREGLDDPLMAVMMGANVADEMARDEFCEATIGCISQSTGSLLAKVFDSPKFRVSVAPDPEGVELCGALKNVVALGAGFCEGMGYGGNTKAAVMRRGLLEMRQFCRLYYSTVQDSTFFESCGIADLITSCMGGRNRKCAARFAREGGLLSWDEIEEMELGGQKLQGTHTLAKVYQAITRRKAEHRFPLFCNLYRISFEKHPLSTLFQGL